MNIWTRCGLTSSELPCTHFFMAWENMEPKREERSGCISEIINESLPPNCRLHLTSSRWVNIFQSRWSHSLIWYRTILHVVGSKEQRRKRFFNISEESELWGQQEQQLHELYIHGSTVDVFFFFSHKKQWYRMWQREQRLRGNKGTKKRLTGRKEREPVGHTFGFLHVGLRLCLPDKLAHLIHLPERHPSDGTEETHEDKHGSLAKG